MPTRAPGSQSSSGCVQDLHCLGAEVVQCGNSSLPVPGLGVLPRDVGQAGVTTHLSDLDVSLRTHRGGSLSQLRRVPKAAVAAPRRRTAVNHSVVGDAADTAAVAAALAAKAARSTARTRRSLRSPARAASS